MIVISYAQMLTLMLHTHNNCSTVLPLLAKEIHNKFKRSKSLPIYRMLFLCLECAYLGLPQDLCTLPDS